MEKIKDDFAVFILSHGRANNVKTIKTLNDSHYTGKTYIICDDEDDQIEDYKKIKCDGVIVFNKMEQIEITDTEDNFKDHRLVIYARNKCHDIAKELKLKYFLVLDDDYTEFCFRYKDNGHLRAKKMNNANKIFNSMCDFLETSNAITVAMSQAGDFIGGAENGNIDKEISRKAMNSFFCMTERPFKYYGSINEDVNSYIYNGMIGKLMFTIYKPSLIQTQTQSSKGGLTDIYLASGTYVKSFYSVIIEPSCARVAVMNTKNPRIHHKILWNNCCPKILNQKFKK